MQITQNQLNSGTNQNDLSKLHARWAAIRNVQLAYVPNEAYQADTFEATIKSAGCKDTSESGEFGSAATDLTASDTRLCQSDLLTSKQEAKLFHQMNLLKYCFCELREEIERDGPELEQISLAEALLNKAYVTRNQIVRANMRLVVSLARKFVSPQHVFDDHLSEGTWSLMQAVDKFDYNRGFRFSTYAYRAIVRNILRNINKRKKANALCVTSVAVETVVDCREEIPSETAEIQAGTPWQKRLAQLCRLLNSREQLIVSARFALGPEQKVSTLQSLANELQISKERVRQLEKRALEKLKRFANDSGHLELLESAI